MPLTPEQIREIATEAAKEAATVAARNAVEEALERAASKAAERVAMDRDEVRAMMSDTVRQTLIQLGIGSDDPIEMQKDMLHLRDWRKSMESIRSKGVLTIVTIAVSGTLAALWVGLKELIGR